MTELTDEDVGKPIFSHGEIKIGTLRGVDRPTIYLRIDEDISTSLRGSMPIAETTAIPGKGENYAAATMAAVGDVNDDEIHFWPSYATDAEHESVSYEEIPGQDSNIEPEDS
jgi:hypothetical protein